MGRLPLEPALTTLTLMDLIGRPDESVAAALYMAYEESRFITGIDASGDGGLAQV